jgi:hypothetical protein
MALGDSRRSSARNGAEGKVTRARDGRGPEDQCLLFLLWGGLVKFLGGEGIGMKEIGAEMGFWGKGGFWREGRKWSVFRGMAGESCEGWRNILYMAYCGCAVERRVHR